MAMKHHITGITGPRASPPRSAAWLPCHLQVPGDWKPFLSLAEEMSLKESNLQGTTRTLFILLPSCLLGTSFSMSKWCIMAPIGAKKLHGSMAPTWPTIGELKSFAKFAIDFSRKETVCACQIPELLPNKANKFEKSNQMAKRLQNWLDQINLAYSISWPSMAQPEKPEEAEGEEESLELPKLHQVLEGTAPCRHRRSSLKVWLWTGDVFEEHERRPSVKAMR